MSGYMIAGIALAGLVLGILIDRVIAHLAGKSAREVAQGIRDAAARDAEHLRKEAELAAKDQMIRLRDEFEKQTRERREELQQVEKQAKEREANLERKLDAVQHRQEEVNRREEQVGQRERLVKERQEELEALCQRQRERLEAVAGLTREQAKEQLLAGLDEELVNERGTIVRRHVDELKQRCQRESQKLLVEAMQRLAGELANERTTATVPLPSDEMKGRIIGREGRNIRVFEAITGVNVLIDDTPSAVVISCFEPVRREIARLALERLVADGRIHPTRVEEVVAKAKKDVQTEVAKEGEDALHELQITNCPPPVAKMLGRLKYRYSYSQNVLAHSLEVARLMGMLAAELGLDVQKAKRMGLFHDLGKAMDHEVEGSHALIGMEFLKRAGEDPEVCNGVGCHHGDVAPSSPLTALVSVADALSASRPGARAETTEIYIKRLEQLEQIGNSFNGIEQCYAVQAGREIRIVVQPDKVGEQEAFDLARQLAKRIEGEMQFPGQIKVCVIRETRSVEYAK